MIGLRKKILSLVIDGTDLWPVMVERSPFGARERRAPVVRGFLGLAPEAARRALDAADTSREARIILTIPSAWCGVRAVDVGPREWPGARDELAASIDRFLPFSPDDAMVGYLARAADPGASSAEGGIAPGGYLVAARRSVVEPWLGAISAALGRGPDAVIAPCMALAGLGLQHEPRAVVLERQPSGALLGHHLGGGRVVSLAEPWEGDDSLGCPVYALNDGSGASGAPASGAIGPGELALAAALVDQLGFGPFQPLTGKLSRVLPWWLIPGGLAAAAAIMFILAGPTRDGRYERAWSIASAERASIAPAVMEVELVRDRARRLSGLIDAGVKATITERRTALPLLADAAAAVTPEGFIYRLALDEKSVTVEGEAARYLDVLSGLEASSAFARARQVNPSVGVSERKLDTYSLRAEREDVPPAPPASAQPPAPSVPAKPAEGVSP